MFDLLHGGTNRIDGRGRSVPRRSTTYSQYSMPDGASARPWSNCGPLTFTVAVPSQSAVTPLSPMRLVRARPESMLVMSKPLCLTCAGRRAAAVQFLISNDHVSAVRIVPELADRIIARLGISRPGTCFNSNTVQWKMGKIAASPCQTVSSLMVT